MALAFNMIEHKLSQIYYALLESLWVKNVPALMVINLKLTKIGLPPVQLTVKTWSIH